MKFSETQKIKLVMLLPILLAAVMVYPDLASASLSAAVKTEDSKEVILFDGNKRQVMETHASGISDLLAEHDIMVRPQDKIWMSTKGLREGTIIGIDRAVPVFLEENGKTRMIYTTQQTVQGVLDDAGLDWRKVTSTEDGMTKVREGMHIRAVPYTIRTVTREESIPVSYVNWYDASLPAGDKVVVEPGREGRQRVTVEEYVSNGQVIRTKALRSVVSDPGKRGVAKTGDRREAVGWVTVMHATAYHPLDGNGEGITASGTKAKHGVVAVDPSFLSLGTKVYIPGYGEAVAEDTGSAIVGNDIDLCMESYDECYHFGRKNIEVFVRY